ncbi:M13 family metallopeptidase [Mycoplasma miroungirhinis]|uniref:M13 family metallopeptidase n=1 Tax=Mycoplasma miroungirhinis TaxID=754516 RepID=A0A6M4JBR1_9MOLU|nr:M13 family metallopeptidase [Mycoplasma miroungirhinis]QJR44360.1 M13 family metallopeptidase [Mycoplasma miroungirhinis]
MDKQLLKDDFYEAINGEWLKSATIRADKTSTGTFMILHEQMEKLQEELIDKWSQNLSEIPSHYPKLVEMVKLYQMANNWTKRTQLATQPIQHILDFIKTFTSFEDVFQNYQKMLYIGLYVPIEMEIYTNLRNSEQEILYIDNPSTILPAKNMYENEEKKASLYYLFKQTTKKLLEKFNYSDTESDKLIQQALTFDESLWKYTPSPEFSAEILNIANIMSKEEIKNQVKSVDIISVFENILKNKIEFANVIYPDFFKNFDKIFTKESFENYKARLLIHAIYNFAPFLTDEIRILAGEFSRGFTGVKEATKKELSARNLALSQFNMVFGKFYGETYFGAKAKKDVENMVSEMIKVYKKRLSENTWLSKDTIVQAQKKLSSFKAYVGYPDKINHYYDLMFTKTYEDGSNLVENIINFRKLVLEENWNKYLKTKDKTMWSMSPAVINAYYSPTDNKIVFPAAILQAPFYSINQSSSKNFGGIGTVMAHEISHGFDNNGANFDENGNIKNWWTSKDYENLKEKEQKMINLFDGIETEYGISNGKLTVSENIADCGGVACAFESAKMQKDFNAKEFMINYATIWRAKYLPKYAELLLLTDVHSLTKLRANIQLANMDEFYQEFDIKETDKMYISPQKRVKIW